MSWVAILIVPAKTLSPGSHLPTFHLNEAVPGRALESPGSWRTLLSQCDQSPHLHL